MTSDALPPPSFEPLEWDSRHFGIPIARLSSATELLPANLEAAARAGIRLAYWSCAPEETSLNDAAIRLGGVQVDSKCIYERQLSFSGQVRAESGDDDPRLNDRDALVALALQSGELSRFRLDPFIPAGAWRRLYETWIIRSLNHEIANAVLIERAQDRPVAMITLACDGATGEIGLFAVDAGQRGRGVGRRLLERALAWFGNAGCERVRVSTQGANAGARRVYERSGFVLAEQTNVYHFWIDTR